MEYAGNVVLIPAALTLRSAVWRTMALRLFWPYCHTCAVPAGEKFAKLMLSAISPVVLLSTRMVSAESYRCAAKMESTSALPVVAETLVPPNWLPLPS